jgi:hypothetical protein
MIMKHDKPEKPSQFTESYQFIQSLFHEPADRKEELVGRTLRVVKRLALVIGLFCVASVVWFCLQYDVFAFETVNGVLTIPKR